MSYPPKVTEKDKEALAVIARGHPDRKITAIKSGRSRQVSALTWDEIQVSLNVPFQEFVNSMARLGANDYIESTREKRSLWSVLRGETETYYSWVTPEGEAFLQADETETSAPSEQSSEGLTSTPNDIEKVQTTLKQLGYDLTEYGAGVALLSLESGYNDVETASHFALATLALDAKEAGRDILKLGALVPHASAMTDILSDYKNSGLMRQELFQNDARAMMKVVVPDKERLSWIERVLSDPIISKKRVAVSRINYEEKSVEATIDGPIRANTGFEGDQFDRLRQAIATVSPDPLVGKDATQLAACAAATLTLAILRVVNGVMLDDADLLRDDDDDFFLAAIFAFAFSNYFATLLAGNFEKAAVLAVHVILGPEEFDRCFNTIQSSYNAMARPEKKNNINDFVGKRCEAWLKQPTSKQFHSLCATYKVLRDGIVQK